MCTLVMSPLSRDYIKMEIYQLKYQQCFNLRTYVHVWSIHTAPGF